MRKRGTKMEWEIEGECARVSCVCAYKCCTGKKDEHRVKDTETGLSNGNGDRRIWSNEHVQSTASPKVVSYISTGWNFVTTNYVYFLYTMGSRCHQWHSKPETRSSRSYRELHVATRRCDYPVILQAVFFLYNNKGNLRKTLHWTGCNV